jgi:gamma-glutamylaminecyclotransferase
MPKTILFFYGTLKSGESNNHMLAGQEFIRAAETVPIYRLFGLGWHPGLILDRDDGLAVKGELWAVDEKALAILDEYEGVPHWFRRDDIAIADLVGNVQAYFFNGTVPEDAPSGDRWPLPQ